jgi:hypothetical protein
MLVPYLQIPNTFSDDRDPQQTPYLFTSIGVPGGNQYSDQHGYTYNYNPATQEFLVVAQPDGQLVAPNLYWGYYAPAPGGWMELTKITHPTIGAALHAYTANGNLRLSYHGNRYQLLPGNGFWVDNQGRFMNHFDPPTVLTDDGLLRRKYYAVTSEGQDFIVPFKKTRENYNGTLRVPYAAGLPGLFGGNMDYNEQQSIVTLQRETREESGSRYTLNAITAGFTYHEATQSDDMNFYSADVTAQAGPFQVPHEMSGSFRVLGDQFTVGTHTLTIDVFCTRLLDLFDVYLGTPAAVAINNVVASTSSRTFLTGLRGLAPTQVQQRALADWNQSATRTVLYRAISIEAGLVAAQRSATNAATPAAGVIGQYANQGWSDYVAGMQAAQVSALLAVAPVIGGAGGQVSRAHRLGWDDYVAGMQAAQASALLAVAPVIGGAGGQVSRAHRLGWDDYVAGIQAVSLAPALNAQAAPATARAYKVAWSDYLNGVNSVAVVGIAPRAYQLAREEYEEGFDLARTDRQCPPGASLSKREGYRVGSNKRQKV